MKLQKFEGSVSEGNTQRGVSRIQRHKLPASCRVFTVDVHGVVQSVAVYAPTVGQPIEELKAAVIAIADTTSGKPEAAPEPPGKSGRRRIKPIKPDASVASYDWFYTTRKGQTGNLDQLIP